MSGCLLIFRPAVTRERLLKLLENTDKAVTQGSVIGINIDPGCSGSIDFSIAGDFIAMTIYIDPSSRK